MKKPSDFKRKIKMKKPSDFKRKIKMKKPSDFKIGQKVKIDGKNRVISWITNYCLYFTDGSACKYEFLK